MADSSRVQSDTLRTARSWRVTLAIFSLGLTTLVTQVILVREFLSVFYGNELVIGVLFANWMVLTALGAFLGRLRRPHIGDSGAFALVLMILGFLPLVMVFLLRVMKNVVFPVGTMVGLAPIFLTSFALLAPFCLFSGFLFALFAPLIANEEEGSLGRAYANEALGSFSGGIIYSLILIFLLNTFQSLAALFALNGALAIAVGRDSPNVWGSAWVVAALVLIPLLLLNPDVTTKRWLHPGEVVVYSNDSPYGNTTVTRLDGQTNFYSDDALIASTNDAASREEPVHFALAQHPAPKSVLVCSGALSGMIAEVLKYGVNEVDYVEINPALMNLARGYAVELGDRRVRVTNTDPRIFVRDIRRTYDAVLLNVPEPSTLQSNRYYTEEFFQDIKEHLSPGGVLSFGLLPGVDYQSEEATRINSTMMRTLKSLFREVMIVPGDRMYFVASDSVLSIRIGALMDRRSIATKYVNKYYFDDDDLERRSRSIEANLSGTAPVNRDLEPISFYRHLTYWLSYFRSNLWPAVGVSVVLLILLISRLNVVSVGLLTAGFAASTMEMLVLFSFQILCGYVYQMLGVIVASFMAGLAAGAHLAPRIIPNPTASAFIKVQLSVAALCFLFPLVLLILKEAGEIRALVATVSCLLAFLIAALIGLEFSIGSVLRKGRPGSVAAELYGSDLVGSALGALLAGTLLVPTIGFGGAAAVAGSLSVISALVTLFSRRRLDAVNV